jgi:Protein of unknown function (DUF4232)
VKWPGHLATVAAALLCAACAAGSNSSPAASPDPHHDTSSAAVVSPSPTPLPTDVVPWLDAPATRAELAAQTRPVPPPPVTGPSCRVRDLRLSAKDRDGASGNLFYYVFLRNVGPTRCVVEGYPSVTASVDGRTQTLHLGHRPFMGLEDEVKVALVPGAEAGAYLDLLENTDFCPGALRPPLRDVSVTPAAQRVVVIDAWPSYCDLTESAWHPADPDATPETAIESRLKGVTGLLEWAKRAVRAGNLLTYDIALTNRTTHPIALIPCPIYEVGGLGGDHLYRLNCAAQPNLPAAATVRFAMPQVRVPANWPSDGKALKLAWLIPGTDVYVFPGRG